MALVVFGGCVRGPAHAAAGLPCQDAWAWAAAGPDAVVLAVADGAGSARHAELGAATATGSAVAATVAAWRAAWDGHDLAGLASGGCASARQAVCRQAAAAGLPPRALACTLLVVVACAGVAVAAHIGDGAVLTYGAEGWRVLSGPAETEYVNETRFLTDRDWLDHVRMSEARSGVQGLLALTDGCQRAALIRRGGTLEPFGGFVDPLARYCAGVGEPAQGGRALADLLGSAKLCQASDDDKTLAAIWRRSADG